jgi:hypothetical protein
VSIGENFAGDVFLRESTFFRQKAMFSRSFFAALVLLACLLLVPVPSQSQSSSTPARTLKVHLPHQSGIALRNTASGNVCIENDEPTEICESAEFIDIVGENMCKWSEDIDYPCTYYGYQFDYEGAQAGRKITCDTHRSTKTTFSPETEQVTGPMTARYTIELDSNAGHIFHTAYNTYAPVDELILIRELHRCSYEGALLYEVHWIVRFTPED